MIRRRPMLVTPWSIWIKPRLRVKYIDIRFWKDLGMDENGKQKVQLVDELDREYFVRLSPRQYRMLRWRAD